jgi:hypothetical protein
VRGDLVRPRGVCQPMSIVTKDRVRPTGGKPVAVKAARRVWRGKSGDGSSDTAPGSYPTDTDVTVTSWTSAPIPWPRCCRPDTHGGGSGLLVTEELVRAIRTESAAALKHWFGVSTHTVWSWRRAFGVGRWDTEGSKLLHQELSERGAEALRGRRQSEETVCRRVQTRRERGCPPPNRWAEDGWKPEEVTLLGTVPDDELARRLGRSVNSVSGKRRRLKIPNPREGSRSRAEGDRGSGSRPVDGRGRHGP